MTPTSNSLGSSTGSNGGTTGPGGNTGGGGGTNTGGGTSTGCLLYTSSQPKTIEEVIGTVTNRVIDLLGVVNESYRWGR